MRIGSCDGRLVLVRGERALDVERASGGRFSPNPQDVFADWDAFTAWAADAPEATDPLDATRLRACVPAPRQVFAIGLNYKSHAAEGGHDTPQHPVVFTKFPSAIACPNDDIPLSGDMVDWELELVIAMSRTAFKVSEADAWDHVAGVTLGQDISDRSMQYQPPVPQFSLAKSFPAYGPIGPVLVTPDEFADRDDIELSSTVNGEQVQAGRTGNMIFSVPELIARLSAVLPLMPGDLIFTGTMDGVGKSMTPPRYLRPGDLLISESPEIGVMENRCIRPRETLAAGSESSSRNAGAGRNRR